VSALHGGCDVQLSDRSSFTNVLDLPASATPMTPIPTTIPHNQFFSYQPTDTHNYPYRHGTNTTDQSPECKAMHTATCNTTRTTDMCISLICTLDPDLTAVAESMTTLHFAQRNKKVQLNAKKKVVDTDALLEQYWQLALARHPAQEVSSPCRFTRDPIYRML